LGPATASENSRLLAAPGAVYIQPVIRVPFLLPALALLGISAAALAAPVDSGRYVERANEMLARADTTGAIDLLEHSHLDDHKDPRAALLLGRLFREMGTIDSRLRSQHVLENTRLRFPNDPDVLLELGRTYFAQRFFPDAIGTLQHALKIDPKRCDARFLVGLYHYRNWKRLNSYKDDLDASRRNLRAAWKCDPKNVDAARLYLYACYALADTSTREADEMIALFPTEGCFRLYRGALAYDAGQYELCGRYFYSGLSLLSPEDRAAYEDLTKVLPANFVGRFRDIGRDARDVFRRGYWVAEDPDPTTEANERELEHIYRVFVSDMLFSNDWTGRRGWNCDRGGTLIKFGRPLSIDYSLGMRQDGAMETWSYERGGELRQFIFVDEFLNGDPRIPYTDDFVLHNLLHDPEISSLQNSTVHVDGTLDVIAFRDDDLHASVYAGMQVDADTVESVALPGSTNMYLLRGAYFDTSWNREGGRADTVWTSQLPPRSAAGRRVIEFVRRLEVPFGAYRLAYSMTDEHTRMRALARGDTDARRFASGGLTLSDVLLYEELARNGKPAAGAISRGGLRMRPRIGRTYAPEDPLRSYVEVYGLHVLDGASEYEVRYSIFPAKPRDTSVWSDLIRSASDLLGFENSDPVISQSFTRHDTRHNAAEYIAIDIKALEPGNYELLVEVMDLNAGSATAARTSLTVEAARNARR
jgi:GWxTD domain-containing protein